LVKSKFTNIEVYWGQPNPGAEHDGWCWLEFPDQKAANEAIESVNKASFQEQQMHAAHMVS
jgi:hypothetical protein